MTAPDQIIRWRRGSSRLPLRLARSAIPEWEPRALPLKGRTPVTPSVPLCFISTIETAIHATVIPTSIGTSFETVVTGGITTIAGRALIVPTPLPTRGALRTPVCRETSTACTVAPIRAGALLFIGATPATVVHAPPADRRLSVPLAAAGISLSVGIRTTSVAAPRSSSPGRTAGTAFKARAHGRGVEDVERVPA